jgi:hypothetical protein
LWSFVSREPGDGVAWGAERMVVAGAAAWSVG